MDDDYDFLSCTLFEDQDFFTSLSLNQDIHIPSKRTYDDRQSKGSKSPQTKKLGRKLVPFEKEDEEKMRRKEQNRAAQRAFRERKERHVKELEKRFKQFQDKHTSAIQQLIHENQYLRSVICRLEVENYVLKGTPVNPIESVSKALENARTVIPLPPPPSPANFQISLKPPLSPLQIRPSSMESLNQARRSPSKQAEINRSTESCQHKGSAENTDRDFTFSITTPDTLRAHTQNVGRNQHFPPVNLYPDHRHPITLMRKERLKKEAQEPIEPESVDSSNEEQELDAFLKPFLETHDDINTHGTISRAATQPVPERKSKERRQHTSSRIWQRVSQHASNPKFSVHQLLNAVKKSTLLTNERLVLDEWDMEQMLEDF